MQNSHKKVYAIASISPFCFECHFVEEHRNREEKLLDFLKSARRWLVLYQISNWGQKVREFVKQYGDDDLRRRIMELMNGLYDKNRIVECPKTSILKNEKEFVSLIRRDPRYSEIDFLLYSDASYGKTCETIEEKEIEPPEAIPLLKQGEKEIERMLKPLLLFSRKVDIYDPYFNLSDAKLRRQYKPALRIIGKYLGQGCKNIEQERFSVTVHYGEKSTLKTESYVEIASVLSDLYREFPHITFVFCHWENSKHDRFIKLDQNFLQVGKGIGVTDEHMRSDSTWSRVDESSASDILVIYNQSHNRLIKKLEPPYEIVSKQKFTLQEIANEMNMSVEEILEQKDTLALPPFFPKLEKEMPPLGEKQKNKLIDAITKG